MTLLARFRGASDGCPDDAREQDLPRYIRNLNQVERDLLGGNETANNLPAWIG